MAKMTERSTTKYLNFFKLLSLEAGQPIRASSLSWPPGEGKTPETCITLRDQEGSDPEDTA